MTQLWWKHQCTRNRKKMCFQLSSKQRKLSMGEASKHSNIKPFALGVKRKTYLHPKVFTVKNCWVPCLSPGTLYNFRGKPWRLWEMKDQGKFKATVFKLDFMLLLSEIWRKVLKAPVVVLLFGFFFSQGYHKRYFLFPLTLPHFCSQLKKDLYKCQNSNFSLQNLYHLSSSEIMIPKGEYSDKNLGKMTILLWAMLPVTKGQNVFFRQFLMNSL